MWRNPNYHPADDQADAGERPRATAPVENGRRLVALPRTARNQPDAELRVSLDEFQGHPYISIRLWQQDSRSGSWWPVKGKGVSVRLGEAEEVADALREALRVVEAESGGTSPRAVTPNRARPAARTPALPEVAQGGGFNEFEN